MMDKAKLLALATGVFFGLLSPSAWAKKQFINMTVGMTREIPISNMPKEVADDTAYNKTVVKIAVATSLKVVRFEPIAVGKTNFILRDMNGKVIEEFVIKVQNSDLGAVSTEIKGLLGDIDGIEIKMVNGRVVVDGEILLPRDLNRIITVLSNYDPSIARSMVTLSPMASKKIASQIEKDIGNPEITVRAVNEKFILEGTANSGDEKERSEIIARTYLPDVIVTTVEKTGDVKTRKIETIVNLIGIKPGPEPKPGKTIKIIIHYVELQKDFGRAFKFEFRPSLSDDSGVQFSSGNAKEGGGVIGALTGTISNLLPKLNYLKSHGHARVLQSSSIIVEDGSPGIIKSVTRIPYAVQNATGALSTAFADAGIDTSITPQIVSPRSNSINLTITFSLKSLIGNTDKGPLISDRSIQTRVVVRDSQSAAIGGLVTNDTSTGYNRLPTSANSNPIISLYASKQFQRNQSQFVVFITPVIMSSASEGSEEVKKKFRLKR